MIAKDKQILNNLIKDSRIEISQISLKENIPISTVFDRIERLREEGVINKFSCLLNYKYLHCPLQYIFFINGDPGDDHRINLISSLSTPDNFMITAMFKNLEDLENFKNKLKNKKIKIRKQFAIYEKIKENSLILD